MRMLDVIIKKREGNELTSDEIDFFIQGYIAGAIPDYQAAALLMAVYFRGMTTAETALLTMAMLNSGQKYNLAHIPGLKVDKHSTGGVGDKVSLILAPLAAALGMKVPMMAGRGLGHTGGTLDKLESIPGYTTTLTEAQFLDAVEKNGFAIIGQTDAIVPADKLLYALRDVTGTVESIPLITASILSKKFAEGSDCFVFDVKCGTGAFMKTLTDAENLAHSLVNLGTTLGKRIKAVITAMDEPLGMTVGNFLEMEEVAACLQGKGPDDIMALTFHLTSCMLLLTGKAVNMAEALAMCQAQIANGRAWQKFLENIACQGGNPALFTGQSPQPQAAYQEEWLSPGNGYIENIEALLIGNASVLLGAGRAKKGDPVSAGAGIRFHKKAGESVVKGDRVATLYADNKALFREASMLIEQAIHIGQQPVSKNSLILKEI